MPATGSSGAVVATYKGCAFKGAPCIYNMHTQLTHLMCGYCYHTNFVLFGCSYLNNNQYVLIHRSMFKTYVDV